MKRIVALSVLLASLFVMSCFDDGTTTLTLVNDANDPFHAKGTKVGQGSSIMVGRLKHGSIMSIPLERMGSTWATLTVTSNYSPKDDEPTKATITVTENPYGTFHASSDNSAIDVSVEN